MRDVLSLAVKTEGLLNTTDPNPWREQFGEGWMDLYPWFGWNVPEVGRYCEAVGLGLAVQCAAVKARDIAKSEMVLWERRGTLWEMVPPNGHWFARMLARKPNSYHSWTEFWRMVVLHLELVQNAYIVKRINRMGEVSELIPVVPARARMVISNTGRRWYEVAPVTEFERSMLGNDALLLPESMVIHLKGTMVDGCEGLSNTTLGNPVFELMNVINRYQTGLFGHDGKTPLVFETDAAFPSGDAAETAFRRLKEQLREAVRKARTYGDAILLEAGLKAKSIAINSRDAMTAEVYNQQVARICGIMQCPPHKIFHYENVNYNNQTPADNQYANDCLIPTAKNIEEKFADALLTEQEIDEYAPEFDRLPMQAGDPKTLMDVIYKALTTGIMEINEARMRLPMSLNPIPGGDVRFVPVNMAIVDREGNVIQQAATGQNQGPPGVDEDEPVVDDDKKPADKGLRLVR